MAIDPDVLAAALHRDARAMDWPT